MYVGSLSDFFYKPKNFVLNLPKYKQKQEITYLNINNRIFRINNITGNITLVTNTKENQLTLNEKSFKNKNKFKKLSLDKSRNNNNLYNTMNTTSKTRETEIKEYANRTINNALNKNNDLIINKNKLFNLINASKTSYKITSRKIKSIKTVEETFKNQIFPYFNKPPKKIIKPNIAFGHKIYNETIPNKCHINKYNDKNLFLTIYKQHFNNINYDGNNDKIYFETKNDNLIMKAFKEQILKEKIEKELKNKFKFYLGIKNNKTKMPHLTHKNFDFYNGYSISDTKRGNSNYHKIFFRNVNKHKYQESLEDNI